MALIDSSAVFSLPEAIFLRDSLILSINPLNFQKLLVSFTNRSTKEHGQHFLNSLNLVKGMPKPSSFHGCFFEYLPIFIHLKVCGISLTRFNKFRRFWQCSFVDPLVKVTDNFWKIRGLIDGFNESRRQIYSGREKPQMSQ